MNALVRMICCVATILLCRTADAESLSCFFEQLIQEEKASRAPEKPLDEMTDAEVIAHAGEQVQDTVNAISVGVFSAIERSTEKAVKHAANLIRKQESVKATEADKKAGGALAGTRARSSSLANSNNAFEAADASASDTVADTEVVGGRIVSVVVILLIVSVVVYGISYMRVRAGKMVVYASWVDFTAASAWVVLGLVGYGCNYASANGEVALKTVASILKLAGCASAVWLIGGAFLNRGVFNVLLAIPARIIVAVLILLAWSKLKAFLDGLRDANKRDLVDGFLVPFAIAMFVFNVLVKPMIGDRRT